MSTLATTDPELIDVFDNFAFDEVLEGSTLDVPTRLMVQLAATIAARHQIAEVLVASLTSVDALGKSFELVATRGEAQDDLNSEFARLDADLPGALDAVHVSNMPLEAEPQRVREDLQALKKSAR